MEMSRNTGTSQTLHGIFLILLFLPFHSKSTKYEPELLKGFDGGPVEWSQIDIQVSHSVGITPKGELYEWGNGNIGSLRRQPQQVNSLMGKTVTHVCCGGFHTAVVTREGELFTR